jgi:hypothetical protein
MRRFPTLVPVLLALALTTGCHRQAAPPPRVSLPPSPPAAPVRVLIVREDGEGLADCARELAALLAHFEERCSVLPASEYKPGLLGRYPYAFYLTGTAAARAQSRVAADASSYQGTLAWIGGGIQALGDSALSRLHLTPDEGPSTSDGWLLSYRGQSHVEWLTVPGVRAGAGAKAQAEVQSKGDRRPFLVGNGKLWYAAAGPAPGRDHFWSRCVWADALHEMLACSHPRQRRLVAVLRDVPVWVNERQVPAVIQPLLAAQVPVSVLAAAKTGDVLLSERPAAVRGLRRAEALGAVITLSGEARSRAREELRMAWEVGLHPLAWAGPTGEDNPFRLRVAGPDDSPPFSAGGLLPAPIPLSDAGYISREDAAHLQMLEVVRDAVALVSFGLWAAPQPFLRFVKGQEARGWRPADLRDLGALVTDSRRTLVSGQAKVLLPSDTRLRKRVFGPRWEEKSEETVSFPGSSVGERSIAAPERSAVALEAVRRMPARPFLTGVTLDPWSYSDLGVSSETLAEALAERYSRNGVNTVFCYAYNVDEGAAYRTRYRGASTSDWGRQDLLGHLLEACHGRGVRVVAWLYSGRDRGMWLRHPEWRERTAGGKEYNPLRLHATYFLCPRNPEVRRWHAGLVQDLARRYPTLDGIELCEPLVNWWGDQACYCEVCRREFAAAHPREALGGPAWRRFRAQGLGGFLSHCLEAISQEGIDTYIMTISDAWSNGAILSPQRQADESGFDLDALLDGPHPPDWVNFEVIWQQWAAIYGAEVFNSRWAAEAAQQLVRRTDGRARVVLHVELTDFGSQQMTPAKIAETISRVSAARPNGIECYHSAAVDSKAAWSVLKRSFEGLR